MLSGQLPEAHGILWNDNEPARGAILVPTIFSLAHDAGLRTVMVVGKEKFEHLNAPGSVDQYVFALNGDQDVADRAVAEVEAGFDVMFVNFPNTDYFGHLEGWMSETQIAQLSRTDEAVARLLAALPPDTVVIVTADHGGHGVVHGSRSAEDMTIPWLIAGPGVRAGHELTGPVSVMDTAATAAYVLGLALPPEAAGRPVLEAFTEAEGAAPTEAADLASFLDGRWSTGAAGSPARSEMPAVLVDGLIYVPGGLGGENVFQAYDPAADTWTDLAPLPGSRHHLMAAAWQGKVFVFGGAVGPAWQPSATTYIYDPAADVWTEGAPLPEPRMSGAAVTLGDRLYVVGGVGVSTALLEYDPAADTWRTLAGLHEPREHVAAAALGGEIYALGGRWNGPGELSTVEIYDPAADAWRPGPPLLRTRSGFNADVLEGRIFIAGGEIILSGSEALNSLEVYDPATQTWSPGPELPFRIHGNPVAAADGRFFVLGGSTVPGAVANIGVVMVYAP
jgi:N-acetylneuraminic acid mutarotase